MTVSSTATQTSIYVMHGAVRSDFDDKRGLNGHACSGTGVTADLRCDNEETDTSHWAMAPMPMANL